VSHFPIYFSGDEIDDDDDIDRASFTQMNDNKAVVGEESRTDSGMSILAVQFYGNGRATVGQWLGQ
jgi:hypothetical protein